MKKFMAVLVAGIIMAAALTGCGTSPSGSSVAETTKAENPALTKKLSDIMADIYAVKAPEIMLMTTEVDVNDAAALKSFTGLENADKIKEAVASEPMMGSQAYSIVLVRVKDAKDAKEVAKAMKSGIDTRKWICVEADTMKVVACDDVIMLAMMSSDLAEFITVDDMTSAFHDVVKDDFTVTLE